MSADHSVVNESSSSGSVDLDNNAYGSIIAEKISFTDGTTTTTKDGSDPYTASQLLYDNIYHKYVINEAYNRELSEALKATEIERVRAEGKVIKLRDDFDSKMALTTKTINEQAAEIEDLKTLCNSTTEKADQLREMFDSQVKLVEQQKADYELLIQKERNTYVDKLDAEVASKTKIIKEQSAEIDKLQSLCDSATKEANRLREICDAQAKDAKQKQAEYEERIVKEQKAYRDKAAEAQADIEGVSRFVEGLKQTIANLTEEKETMETELASMTKERDYYSKKVHDKVTQQSKVHQEADAERLNHMQNIIDSLRKNVSSLTDENENLKADVKFLTQHSQTLEKDLFRANETVRRTQANLVCAETKCNELESKFNKLLCDRYPVNKIGDANDCLVKELHARGTRPKPNEHAPSTPPRRAHRSPSPAISSERIGIRMGLSPIDRKLLKPCSNNSRHPNASHFTGGVMTTSPNNGIRGQSPVMKRFERNLRGPRDADFNPLMSSTPRVSK